MTPDFLQRATGCSPTNLGLVADALTTAMQTFVISTPRRQAHFLAQIAFESGGFAHVEENLNYSAERLAEVFKRYFFMPPDPPTGRENAVVYARKAADIANVVYANRMDNGGRASGDGFRYRGRGYIQITGRRNYTAFNYDCPTVPAVSIPDALCTPEYAALSAAWFWSTHGCQLAADADDCATVSAKINGGDPARPMDTINGYSGRLAATGRAKAAFGL